MLGVSTSENTSSSEENPYAHGLDVPEAANAGEESDDDDHFLESTLELEKLADKEHDDEKKDTVRSRGCSTAEVYGGVLTLQDAQDINEAPGGVIWHCQVVNDDYKHPKHCFSDGKLKPRRPIPHVRACDFFKSLRQSKEGHWIFSGVLNGWPTMTNLELLSITAKMKSVFKPRTVRFWQAGTKQGRGIPVFPEAAKSVRVTLRQPAWSMHGWSRESPGCIWWYFGEQEKQEMQFGENIIKKLKDDCKNGGSMPIATNCTHFYHRYYKAKESTKDKLTYHCGVFLEWDHGKWGTVMELAWLNGVGGYGGKCNWQDDKDAPRPAMWNAMDNHLKAPWRSEFAELRTTDVPMRTKAEFEQYLKKYTGSRFLDVGVSHHGPVRLSFRSQEHITRYCINYITCDREYSEARRNCQHFAADFYGFLAGKKSIQPHGAVCRPLYKQRHWMFLYNPEP